MGEWVRPGCDPDGGYRACDHGDLSDLQKKGSDDPAEIEICAVAKTADG